ncbi:MAG: peptidoglycan DD-metalloendopeptidase family protein [Acidimicrobiales bacterium]|nr:peptidoglycan DD-metalloendopeptidase family protein [Acidimicrobiales bacterium]
MPVASLRAPARHAGALLCALALVVPVLAHSASAAAAEPYRPPVPGPVIDPFRPPALPWAPGNRGVDFATTPGEAVVAAADGDIVFAGEVAGALHVVVLHADGIRTTYAFLAGVVVVQGQRVAAGQRVGTAGASVHFGARLGETYLDPMSLIAGTVRVWLVPVPERAQADPVGDVRALRLLVAEEGGSALGALRAGVAWVRGAGGAAARTVAGVAAGATGAAGTIVASASTLLDTARLRLLLLSRLALGAAPQVRLARLAAAGLAWLRARATCTPVSAATPRLRERRILILVGGLGSSSSGPGASITRLDTAALGYAATDVVQFSYRGGRVPDPTDGLGSVPSSPYTPADTEGDLGLAASRLVELLVDVRRAAPGVAVDVVAHSQGGLVARLALDQVTPGDPRYPDVATFVTLGTPHAGAPLATGVQLVDGTWGGRAVLEGAERHPDMNLHREGTSLAQLSEVSAVVRDLAGRPAPAGVRTVSIAARGDLVVPAGSTRLDGAANATVSLVGLHAHDELPGSPAATREVALAVTGAAPSCRTLGQALADVAVPDLVSEAEAALALGLGGATGLLAPVPTPPRPAR